MRLISHHIEADVERLQEPNHDRSRKDDGKRLGDKTLGLIPCKQQRSLCAGHAVVGKLHDKGHGLALKYCVVKNRGDNHTHQDAQNIERDHGGNGCLREKRSTEQAVDGKLCRAAHERREHDRHFAVVIGRQGARGHDGRHATAKAHKHGHKAATRKAKAAQNLIHHKRDACHIARVLENREQQEQHDDDGQERKHAAHAGEHAVNHKRADHGIGAKRRKARVGRTNHHRDQLLEQALQRRADNAKGEPKDKPHDEDEHWDGGEASRKHTVDGNGALVLAALMRLDHAGGAHILDKGKTHIGKSAQAIAA